MSADDPTSQDSAVIDDDLVEALGFEPITTADAPSSMGLAVDRPAEISVDRYTPNGSNGNGHSVDRSQVSASLMDDELELEDASEVMRSVEAVADEVESSTNGGTEVEAEASEDVMEPATLTDTIEEAAPDVAPEIEIAQPEAVVDTSEADTGVAEAAIENVSVEESVAIEDVAVEADVVVDDVVVDDVAEDITQDVSGSTDIGAVETGAVETDTIDLVAAESIVPDFDTSDIETTSDEIVDEVLPTEPAIDDVAIDAPAVDEIAVGDFDDLEDDAEAAFIDADLEALASQDSTEPEALAPDLTLDVDPVEAVETDAEAAVNGLLVEDSLASEIAVDGIAADEIAVDDDLDVIEPASANDPSAPAMFDIEAEADEASELVSAADLSEPTQAVAPVVDEMPPPPSVFADPAVMESGQPGAVPSEDLAAEFGAVDLSGVDLTTTQPATAVAAAPAAAVPVGKAAPVQRRRGRRRRMRARKSRRVIRHIDPWSVLTFSVLFHMCVFGAMLLGSVLVWNVAIETGTVENVESFIQQLGDYETFEIKADVMFQAAVMIAGLLTLASSILVVLLTVIFNLISDLIGGIRVTVIEEESVRVPARSKTRKGPAQLAAGRKVRALPGGGRSAPTAPSNGNGSTNAPAPTEPPVSVN